MERHPVDIIAEEKSSDGWWKESTRDTFIACYERLYHEFGISEVEILEILGDLYYATAEEFGA